MFVTVLGYMMPFIGIKINMSCYKVFLLNAITSFVMTLYRNHGFPKFNSEYIRQLLLTDSTIIMYLMMSCLLFAVRPYLLAAAPILFIEGYPLARALAEEVKKNPSLMEKVAPTIEQQMPLLVGRSDWPTMSESSRWALVEDLVQFLAATCEVWQGLFFIIELILPTRSLLATGILPFVLFCFEYLKGI
jgi:hypothetical protein